MIIIASLYYMTMLIAYYLYIKIGYVFVVK